MNSHASPERPSTRTTEPSQDQPPDGAGTPSGRKLFGLLGDDYTYRVLREIVGEPTAAREIADATGMSRPTVYRRLERLEAAGLATADLRLDADGHHSKQYVATITRIDVELAADGVDVTVEWRSDERAGPRD